mmetsp:Transcript_23572/g.70827  ORF Transcript_23572/g.70827 Transcript_23572/m.70827 type:complete len:230 (+) Transcript_23572:2037-2726(+)
MTRRILHYSARASTMFLGPAPSTLPICSRNLQAILGYLRNQHVCQTPFSVNTQHVYICIRLYNHLLNRFQLALDLLTATETRPHVLEEKPFNSFNSFVVAVRALADGSMNKADYENHCCHLMGVHSYSFFSLDSLLVNLIKQFQVVVHDKTSLRLIALWQIHERHRSSNIRKQCMSLSETPRALSVVCKHARCLLHCLAVVPQPLYALVYIDVDSLTVQYLGLEENMAC